MKVIIINLGCPKNLTDAEIMAGHLAEAGFSFTNRESDADIALINTCAFIKPAVKESEKEIKRLIALKKRGVFKKIVVTGCLVERRKEEILKRFREIYPVTNKPRHRRGCRRPALAGGRIWNGVDACVGISGIDKIAQAIKKGETFIPEHPRLPEIHPVTNKPPRGGCRRPAKAGGRIWNGVKMRLTMSHSAYLKIADGCNNRCSYCTIPSIRGGFRSKPLEQVLSEARLLAETGAKEISLVAQDTTSYGIDIYRKPALAKLLKKLSGIRDLKWIRVMYAYPERVDWELLETIKNEEKICRYLDMPLQHISDNILQKMNRISREDSIKKTMERIRKKIPDIAVRTNFIAGFPGETEKDFRKLLKFTREAGFYSLGIFKYFREKETPACAYENQIPEREKTARFNALIETQSRVIDKINESLMGKNLTVLMDDTQSGRTEKDAPDIDGRIIITKAENLHSGQFVNARILSAKGYIRTAKFLKNLRPKT
ncbi:MAG: MiaB/RimO family radical SAM methylthiotransferase [Elusimicrobia bacterium]|nr:MiaB/RimO family radical SAM methylthiotransferase [Elusimicrobiota bacterium]